MLTTRLTDLKKSAFIICLLLFLAARSSANNPFDTLAGKSLSQQVELIAWVTEKVAETYSEGKARELLDKEKVVAEAKGDKKLALLIRLWQLRRRFHAEMSPLQVEKEYLSIIEDSKAKSLLSVHLMAHHFLADYYWLERDYPKSFEYEFRLAGLHKDLDFGEYPEKRMYIYQMAERYYGFRDYQNSKRLLVTIPESSLTYAFPGPELYYNLLGLSYRHLEQYDSAIHYLDKGRVKALEKKNYIYDAIIAGNIGISYYYLKQFDRAIPLLEKDIQYCMEKNRALENAAKTLAVLGDTYLQLGQLDKASQYLTTSLSIVRTGKELNFSVMEFVYPFLSRLLAKQGNFTMAYRYMDSAMIIKDSLNKEKSTLLLARAQHLASAQSHLAEVRQLKDQKERQVLIRNFVLAGILSMGLVALLFINRQRISNKRKQEKLESEKKLVATELFNAEVQLQMFTKSIHEKNALIEEFSTQLESLQTGSGTDDVITYEPETMLKLRESTILTDEEWENFRRLFEKVHSGFLERLRTKIPGLSPAETRFIALTKLHLSNKEMAGTLGISTDAVRMNKHRLRKKLNLTDDTSIEELIETL